MITKSHTQADKWKTYPIYKDSGIEWLGEIPKEWEVVPLKQIFFIVSGATPRSNEPTYWEGEIPWATPDDLGNLSSDTLNITKRKITQAGYDNCGTSLVPAGSLVLSTRAPIGHLAIAGVALCVNQGCKSLVFKWSDNCRYYYYQGITARQEFESWGQGSTFTELGRDKLAVLNLLLPPLPQQTAIANFLDRNIVQIDTLIEKKQQQIELLKGKRTALISHTVTKGLDPKANMKDSGIEWIGSIPEEWNIAPLK